MRPLQPSERAAFRRELRYLLERGVERASLESLLLVFDPTDEIFHALPDRAPPADRITACIRALERRDLIDHTFFSELRRVAPDQATRIDRLEEHCLGEGPLRAAVVTSEVGDFADGFDLDGAATPDGLLEQVARRFKGLRRIRHDGRRLAVRLELRMGGKRLSLLEPLPQQGLFTVQLDVHLSPTGQGAATKSTGPSASERAELIRAALAP